MNPEQPGSMLQHALGSGAIVSPDGYILTNNHVVKNAKEIQVTVNDGRTFRAKAIETDPQTDIALVKVDANNLPALTLAIATRSKSVMSSWPLATRSESVRP